jgi:predicted secreted protein
LSSEEQDKDKATAASRVNLKMKQGTELVKQDDPSAVLKTRGYYTYPVYANEVSSSVNNKLKQPIGWRVGQYLDVTTSNLVELPKLVADAQQTMSLNNVHFGLARATAKKLDQEQIDAAYQNLTDRIAFIAKAMGKNGNDAVLESVSFDPAAVNQPVMYARANVLMAKSSVPVEEPSLEPGETTQELHIVGKVVFK